MEELLKRVNLGKVLCGQLREVGITSYEALKAEGSRGAWLKIQNIDPSACYNRLCGLEGAILGVRWHDLPAEIKEELKRFYEEHKIPRR